MTSALIQNLPKIQEAAKSADPPSAAADCKEFMEFVLYYVFPDGTKELAKNAAYKVTETETGAVLAEGVSDENGVVHVRACKDRPDEIRIHAECVMPV
jgi:hypothetical protein